MTYSMSGLGKTYTTSYDKGHSHTVAIPNGGYGYYGGMGATMPGGVVAVTDPGGLVPQDRGAPGSGGTADEGVMAKVRRWWDERSGVEKGAVVVGGLATFGLLVLALTGAPRRRMRPNLSRSARKKLKTAKPGQRVKVGGRSYKVGNVVDVKGGRSFGHKIPPKKYRDKGARTQADYAWPEGYKYPLVFRTSNGKIKPKLTRKHVRAAASYYGKNKNQYPPKVRRTIHRNINRARKRFGVGDGPLAY